MPDISGHTKLAILLGTPVEHSLSPAIHNTSFRQLGVDAVYLVADIASEADLADAVAGARAMGFLGLNVTMPYKTSVIKYLDGLSPAAELMGAVNTIEVRGNQLIGHNTDGAGLLRSVVEAGFEVAGNPVTVIGAGGAGSAVFTQAALDGALAVCLNRGSRQPLQLAQVDAVDHIEMRLHQSEPVAAVEDVDRRVACVDLALALQPIIASRSGHERAGCATKPLLDAVGPDNRVVNTFDVVLPHLDSSPRTPRPHRVRLGKEALRAFSGDQRRPIIQADNQVADRCRHHIPHRVSDLGGHAVIPPNPPSCHGQRRRVVSTNTDTQRPDTVSVRSASDPSKVCARLLLERDPRRPRVLAHLRHRRVAVHIGTQCGNAGGPLVEAPSQDREPVSRSHRSHTSPLSVVIGAA